MLLLLSVVLLNTWLSVLFKLFKKFEVDAFVAIVVNYWVCVCTGSLFGGKFPVSAASLHQPWILPAVLLGVGFIGVFNLISWCTRHYGITPTTIANKLSLIIPVAFALFFFEEEIFHWTKALGICSALPAVFLMTGSSVETPDPGVSQSGIPPPPSKTSKLETPKLGVSTESENPGNPAKIGWVIWLLFLGSGVLDTGMTLLSRHHLKGEDTLHSIVTIHIFFTAALTGTALLVYRIWKKQVRLSPKNLLAGVVLGVPNYFSIYLFVRLLAKGPFQPSVAVPVNNIAVVLSSVLAAIFLFKESVGRRRVLGIALSLLAIFLLSYKNLFPGA